MLEAAELVAREDVAELHGTGDVLIESGQPQRGGIHVDNPVICGIKDKKGIVRFAE
jgi:hypothetical protein